MTRTETPLDCTAEPMHVPAGQRRSWTQVAFARAGGSFAAPVLMVGAGLAMGRGLRAVALGGAVRLLLRGAVHEFRGRPRDRRPYNEGRRISDALRFRSLPTSGYSFAP